MIETNSDYNYRKTFFLYPHDIIQNEMIKEIVKNEYEAYPLFNHMTAFELFNKYRNSILFINIEKKLNLIEWEQYIRGIIDDPDTNDVGIGIISADMNKVIDGTLADLRLPCGYIRLSHDLNDSKKCLLKSLEVNNARGRRRYIRVKCQDKYDASLSIKLNQKMYNGQILDISTAGLACHIENMIGIGTGKYLDDMQVRLKGNICNTAGKVQGIRHQNNIIVILFDYRKTFMVRNKIHNFIYYVLQRDMQNMIEEIGQFK